MTFTRMIFGYLALAFIVTFAHVDFSVAQETEKGIMWMEIWGDTAYRETNFSNDQPPNKQEDFYISNISGKAGARFDIDESIFFDPYLAFEINEDFGDKTWNDVYWNNHMKYGPGVRFTYEYTDSENQANRSLWFNNINVALFTEYLFMERSWSGSDDAIPNAVPLENWRTGVNAWMSVDSKQYGSFSVWAEAWSELAYSTTNFYDDDCDNFYLFIFQPKFGLKWKLDHLSIQPYLTCDLIYDMGDKPWNKAPWLNHIQYGPGIRLSFSDFKGLAGASFHVYTEFLNIDYFSRVDSAQYNNQADEDIRAGIEFWLPFGRTKQSVIRH